MPVMNGVTAAKHMRQQGYPYIIAGVTGNVLDDDVAEYLDAGADIVLAKPVRLNTIMKLMHLIDACGPMRVQGDTTNPNQPPQGSTSKILPCRILLCSVTTLLQPGQVLVEHEDKMVWEHRKQKAIIPK